MTLNQLEYFCAVCRYHSITRAAESLFVSQPTIWVCQEFCVNRFNKQHRIAA
ncbi:LysR family transcriptional regulator, partial [Dialister hominis]|uniref:LysR family transcriptional regulator n=1 Tax=Dialister hominis TaxID=2582419 RepID=UPI004026D78C